MIVRQSGLEARRGFTIVELLIVIVIIAILASITVVTFRGIQQRARDSQRKSDISMLAKAFELYHTKNGYYPATTGSTAINSSWVSTSDASWANLQSILVPEFISKMPRDPISKQMPPATYPWGDPEGYDYSIFTANSANYCATGRPSGQTYLIVYKLEASADQNTFIGDCSGGTAVGPYAGSNYRVTK